MNLKVGMIMRAVVISDSHGNVEACEKAIESMGDIDMIIHLGDIARDVDYIEAVYADIKVCSVVGNNDFLRRGNSEAVIDFDGHKIFICHGHSQSVSSGTQRLEDTAIGLGCEAALFGHTHVPVLKKSGDIMVLNPGSVSRPRGCRPSFAVLETDGGVLKAVIVDWVL